MMAHGVDRAFCVPGESYLALLDALYDRPALDLVVARHEGGAGFMAMADARCAGRPGVCLVSRGPGASNAAIAVHSAEQDGTGLILIVGQVCRSDRGRGAFQEVDYPRMFGAMAKAVWEIADGADLSDAFARAFVLAMSGTPGPVVIVVPEDVFDDRVDRSIARRTAAPSSGPTTWDAERIAQTLAAAERPLVIAGGALDSTAGRAALAGAARRHHVPVALAYKRQDLFDNADPLFAGYLGFKIPRAQVEMLCESDLLLAIGTRLGEVTTQHYRLTGMGTSERRLVHVYPDPDVPGRVVRPDIALAADPVALLDRLADRPPLPGGDRRRPWAQRLHECAALLATYSPTPRPDGVEFGALVQALARRAAPDAVVAMDGGNFGGWVHRLWPWTPANRLIGTAGGAMGIGVPGAVAAGLRYRGRQVIAFAGDGGFMMTGNELATAVHRGIDALVVVSNNRSYATIRQRQQLAYPGRVFATDLGAVDFAALAEACGARGFRVRSLADIDDVAGEALATRGVRVIDVETSLEAISAYR